MMNEIIRLNRLFSRELFEKTGEAPHELEQLGDTLVPQGSKVGLRYDLV
jgi:hypothetical protein